MRARLLRQLNAILETRDTTRGLVVNMSDVLFEFGKYDLRPAARERLARIAGVLLGYPDLHLEIEGRVELVISGDVIGNKSQTVTAMPVPGGEGPGIAAQR